MCFHIINKMYFIQTWFINSDEYPDMRGYVDRY